MKQITFLLLVLLITTVGSASTQERGPSKPVVKSIIGTWKVIQVKEIGSWSIKHQKITDEVALKRIHFRKGNTFIAETGEEEISGKWELEQSLGSIYQGGTPSAILYYPDATVVLNTEDHHFPQQWENVSITKRKLVFFVYHDKGKTVYTLTRIE